MLPAAPRPAPRPAAVVMSMVVRVLVMVGVVSGVVVSTVRGAAGDQAESWIRKAKGRGREKYMCVCVY